MKYVFSTKALNDVEKKQVAVIDQALAFIEKQDKFYSYQVKLGLKIVSFRKVSKDKRTNKTEHIKTTDTLEQMKNYIDNLAEQQKMGYKKVVK